MADIKLKLNAKKHGTFNLYEESNKIGEMIVAITDRLLTVYHTEIYTEAEGKGYAKLLLEYMVSYARENNLKVLALCPYVHTQFKRHPDEYADIWQQNE